MVDKVYRRELTPLSFLRRSAAVFGARVAVVHGERRLTYAQLWERSLSLAAGLRSIGVERGDRVAFLSPNTPALLEAHFGVPAAGAVLVALNTRLSPAEVGYIVEHSGSRVLFADRELLPLAEAIPADVRVVEVADTGTPGDPYESFLNGAVVTSDLPLPVQDEEDTISINYTSGTTGAPKGVMFTHRGAYLNALAQVIEVGLNRDSVYLWTLPMFHCNGWCFPWAVAAVAGRQVCLRKVDPPLIWELFELEGVTHLCGAPTVQIALVADPAAKRLERAVTVVIAGAPPSPTLLESLSELGFRPLHVYGLTETYGPTTLCVRQPEWSQLPREEQARLLARQGVANLTAGSVDVVDQKLAPVPHDTKTMGEVVMEGNIVMKGYFADPAATEQAFEGGWFHSGDVGVVHEDGYIELRDRAKDIIISGGENISTIEVEQAIANHPDVLECAVVARPDPKWGERPKAFVTLRPGRTLSETDLVEFCRERIARFKCPDAVEFGELPKTSTGKVQKYVLREREWAGHGKRIH